MSSLRRVLQLAASCTAVLLVVESGARADVYKVGLAETGHPPHVFPKGDARRGIFMEILDAVGKATGDTFEVKWAPPLRLKSLFEKAQIDIECGISPAWREDQADISVYSRSFTSVVDVVLRRIDDTSALIPSTKGAPDAPRVGAVRGYLYPRYEDRFRRGWLRREDADSEVQLLDMLQKRRVDAIVIDRILALHYMKSNAAYQFRVAEQVDSVPVMYRVHKAHKALLPRLNRELNRMIRSGELAKIFKRYE